MEPNYAIEGQSIIGLDLERCVHEVEGIDTFSNQLIINNLQNTLKVGLA